MRTRSYVKKPLEVKKIKKSVYDNCKSLLEHEFPGMNLISMQRKFTHPMDNYLYICKCKDEITGKFVVFDLYNDSQRILRGIHTGINTSSYADKCVEAAFCDNYDEYLFEVKEESPELITA